MVAHTAVAEWPTEVVIYGWMDDVLQHFLIEIDIRCDRSPISTMENSQL